MTHSCTKCDSEYEDWFPGALCMDCNSPLKNNATGEIVSGPSKEESVFNDETATPIANANQVIVATSGDVPGFVAFKYHGEVFGITVIAINNWATLGAKVRRSSGVEMGSYVKMLTDSREVAISRMRARALQLGANAVIAVRLDANQITDEITELIAYGTAVSVRPQENP